MFLPNRLILLISLVALSGCTTHDRMAYQSNYWRGRGVVGAKSTKSAVDAEVQRQLNEAAAPAGGTAPADASGAGGVAPLPAPGGSAPVTTPSDPFSTPPSF